MIELNLLPGRYRARKLSLTAMRPWLFVITSILVLVLSRHQYSIAHSGLQSVGRDLEMVQAELDDYRPLIEVKDALEAQINILKDEIYEIETAYQFVTIQTIVWSDILNLVVDSAPQKLDFTNIFQTAGEMVLLGFTDEYELPLLFSEQLESMGLFARVSVESIVKVEPPEPEVVEDEELSEPVAPLESETPPLYEFEITLDFDVELEGQ